jgi:ferredoxin
VRVVADLDTCIGAGVCVLTAPAVFDQDPEDGTVRILLATVPTEEERDVREAVDLCSSAALEIVEDD